MAPRAPTWGASLNEADKSANYVGGRKPVDHRRYHMPKHGKNYNAAAAKLETGKVYSPKEAMTLAKELSSAKFDETVEVAIRLGVDTRKADQNIRGSI